MYVYRIGKPIIGLVKSAYGFLTFIGDVSVTGLVCRSRGHEPVYSEDGIICRRCYHHPVPSSGGIRWVT